MAPFNESPGNRPAPYRPTGTSLPTGEANPGGGANGIPGPVQPTMPNEGGFTPNSPWDQVGNSGGVAGPGSTSTGGPGNFGQPMFPWLMPYGGQFTAPMSPYEQNALGDYSQFVQGGQGLNGAQDYLSKILSGQYLDLNSNPYLGQIQSGMQGIKDYQDAQALKRIQSQGAAGGSAMSGANLGAQADYSRNSNNQFQALMGNLMNENYGRERGMQAMAPGQLGQIAQQTGQGYGQMFSMGGLPRQLQQQDLGAQYGDWLRQTGGMQQAFQYPDMLTQQLLYGGGFRGQTPNQYGNSSGDLLSGLLGNSDIDWGSLLSGAGGFLGNLFGGGTTETGGGGGNGEQLGPDGARLGYDAPPSGPSSYADSGYYNKALSAAQAKAAQDQAKAANGPNTMAPALIALLIQMLGGGKKKNSTNQFKPGVGGAPDKKPNDASKAPGYKTNPNAYSSPIGPNNTGGYFDFLNQNFGGSPASDYGSGMYDNPEQSWQELMNNTFGDQSMGGYNPENFGPGDIFGGSDHGNDLGPSDLGFVDDFPSGGGYDEGTGGFGGFDPGASGFDLGGQDFDLFSGGGGGFGDESFY